MNPRPPVAGLDRVMVLLPHRPPFLFVDEVARLEPGVSIVARRTLLPEEPHFAGHFPGRPVMPGVLVTEALAQTCGLLKAMSDEALGTKDSAAPPTYFLAADNVKYTSPAGPGDTLTLIAECEASHGLFLRFRVEALAGRRRIAAGSLTLARMEGRR